MKTKDPLTGEIFIQKRSNQKYASRKNQIRFNNRKAFKKRKSKSAIERILDKNRNIMEKLLADNKEIIKSRDFLLGAGFSFSVLTHTIKKNGTIVYCIYDYAYFKLNNNNYKITKNATDN